MNTQEKLGRRGRLHGDSEMRTLEDALRDVQRRADQQWKPAANGTETPTRFPDGSTLLYCYNPVLREHAYFDCSTDLQVTDAVMESIITGCMVLNHNGQ